MVDTGSGGLCRLVVLFEEYWGEHADGGMASGAVVAFLDPACGGDLRFGSGGPVVAVVELGLERRPERLGGRVVPAHSGASHGAHHAQVLCHLSDLGRGVLGAAVRVE